MSEVPKDVKMSNRALIQVGAIGFVLQLGCISSFAQDNLPPRIHDLTSKYQQGFFDTIPGTIGVLSPNGCNASRKLTGRYVYLVKDQLIYWGTEDDCVRVVINHQANNYYKGPSYLGVQVIGFYDRPRRETLILRRDGNFVRGTQESILFTDKEYSQDQITQNEFDRFHSAGDGNESDQALAEFERKTGVMWHGTPKDGIHNSWSGRRQFRMSNSYDDQISLRYRVLDNRLIAFTPYQLGPDNKRTEDVPRSIDIYRRGARAVAVRIFSPYSGDYGGEFALIFSTNKTVVANLLKSPGLASRPFNSLFASLPRR